MLPWRLTTNLHVPCCAAWSWTPSRSSLTTMPSWLSCRSSGALAATLVARPDCAGLHPRQTVSCPSAGTFVSSLQPFPGLRCSCRECCRSVCLSPARHVSACSADACAQVLGWHFFRCRGDANVVPPRPAQPAPPGLYVVGAKMVQVRSEPQLPVLPSLCAALARCAAQPLTLGGPVSSRRPVLPPWRG